MGHIDDCLSTLARLIADAEPSSLSQAEEAIAQYWNVTPSIARRSGLLYIQQILHSRRDGLSAASRSFADALDARIERRLMR
jgi:hypothetical protein